MDRVSAARESLEAVKATAQQAMDAGPPCSECRYRTLLGMCSNPAYSEVSFDAARGRMVEHFDTPITKARGADGLCGPEAILFSPPLIPTAAIARGTWAGARIVWFGVIAFVFLIFLLR